MTQSQTHYGFNHGYNRGDAGSNPVVAEHFFGSFEREVSGWIEQHQGYYFARIYHSRRSNKIREGSKKVLLWVNIKGRPHLTIIAPCFAGE